MKLLFAFLVTIQLTAIAAPINYGEAIQVDCTFWMQTGLKVQLSPNVTSTWEIDYARKDFSFELKYRNNYSWGDGEYETNDYYNLLFSADLASERSFSITYFSKVKENAVYFGTTIEGLLAGSAVFKEYIPERARPEVMVQMDQVDFSDENPNGEYYRNILNLLLEKGIIEEIPEEFTATHMGGRALCKAKIIEDDFQE